MMQALSDAYATAPVVINTPHPPGVGCGYNFTVKVLNLHGQRLIIHSCSCTGKTMGDIAAIIEKKFTHNFVDSSFKYMVCGRVIRETENLTGLITNNELTIHILEPIRVSQPRLDQISPESRKGPLLPRIEQLHIYDTQENSLYRSQP